MNLTAATVARLLDFEENFNWMQTQIYATYEAHGFHEINGNTLEVPTRLALIMSEAAEALEAHRSGDDEHMWEELADIVIRTMDLAEAHEVDLAQEIVNKAAKNKAREFKHGGKRY